VPKNCSPSLGGRLGRGAGAHEAHLGAERRVERVGPERPGVHRPGDELPERVERGEGGARRAVVVRGRVVHVGRDPDDVAHARPLQVGEQGSAISSSRPSGGPGSSFATAS
jgi:hypothetical protein